MNDPGDVVIVDSDHDQQRKLLKEWHRRNWVNLDCHNDAERLYSRNGTVCALISIGSLVALGVTAAGFDLTKANNRYIVLFLSVVAALASVLQTIRDYGSRAAAHRIAARQHGALCRHAEEAWRIHKNSPDLDSEISELRRRWDWVSENSPNVPSKIRTRRARLGLNYESSSFD